MCLKGDSGAKNNIKITELFYQQSFLNNKFISDFGKLNFGIYFTGNEYISQFITDFFFALKLNYPMIDIILIDIAYAYFVIHFAEEAELYCRLKANDTALTGSIQYFSPMNQNKTFGYGIRTVITF